MTFKLSWKQTNNKCRGKNNLKNCLINYANVLVRGLFLPPLLVKVLMQKKSIFNLRRNKAKNCFLIQETRITQTKFSFMFKFWRIYVTEIYKRLLNKRSSTKANKFTNYLRNVIVVHVIIQLKWSSNWN